MTSFVFEPATRAGSKARIALAGPPGSGKSFTALTIARAFGGTIGVIDTEKGSAAKYTPPFVFKHLKMHTFDPRDLIRAVAAAAEQGVDTLIVDSWSHFWSGTGGMLEQVDKATRRAGRSDAFGSGWREMGPVEQAMLDALTGYPGHLIATLRTKVEHTVEQNPRTGKMEPRKVGLKPVQRDGIEYEFDVVGDMDSAVLSVTKTRCPDLHEAVISKPDDEFGLTILRWLEADAVGEAFNPLSVRDWALEPARTVDELRERFEELDRAGHTGSAVIDGTGETVALGDLLRVRAREIKAARSPLGSAVIEAAAA